jgi:hypothetical protein
MFQLVNRLLKLMDFKNKLPIILLSKGGLGNQLFVYAYAHELSIRTNRKVSILTNWHKGNPARPFGLNKLSLYCGHRINLAENFLLYKIFNSFSRIQSRLGIRGSRILKSIGMFQEPILPTSQEMMSKAIFVEGYFQNFENFRNIEQIVIELKNFIETIEIVLPDDFSAGHLRRGDYIGEVDNFGLLDPKYYETLVGGNGNILICTDDRTLAMKYWGSFPRLTVLGPDELTPWEVVAVLSKSTELYIANSSLSWWAGMVQMNKGGKTYIPQPWFKTFNKNDRRMVAKGMIPKNAIWINRAEL